MDSIVWTRDEFVKLTKVKRWEEEKHASPIVISESGLAMEYTGELAKQRRPKVSRTESASNASN
jgi:hypothetical protein